MVHALVLDADGVVVAIDGPPAPGLGGLPPLGQGLPALLLSRRPFGEAPSAALHDGLVAVLARKSRQFELQVPRNGVHDALQLSVQALDGGRSGAVLTVRPLAASAAPEAPPPPAVAAPAALTDRLRRAEGIDPDAGLAAVGGRVAVYERLLGVFLRAHDGDGLRIVQAFAAGAGDGGAADPRALAHRLRGSAATLGLVAVEQAAAAVEHAPAATPAAEMQRRAGELQAALAETLAHLRHALGMP